MMASRTNGNPLDPTVEEDYVEIIGLLHAKVHGQPLPNGAIIQECDLYGEKNPWEIWDTFGGGKDGSRELYLFSTIKMIINSSELVRTIGLGSWEEQYQLSIVSNDANHRVGVKQCFCFENSGTSHDNASWILHEYRLDQSLLLAPPPSSLRSPSVNSSYVLCKLIKNQGRVIVRRKINDKQFIEATISLRFPVDINKSTEGDDDEWKPAEIKNLPVREESVDKRVTAEEKETRTAAEEGERPTAINTENGNEGQTMVDDDNKKITADEMPDDDGGGGGGGED